MGKYGCDLLGPETLKSALSREQVDELSGSFACCK